MINLVRQKKYQMIHRILTNRNLKTQRIIKKLQFQIQKHNLAIILFQNIKNKKKIKMKIL